MLLWRMLINIFETLARQPLILTSLLHSREKQLSREMRAGHVATEYTSNLNPLQSLAQKKILTFLRTTIWSISYCPRVACLATTNSIRVQQFDNTGLLFIVQEHKETTFSLVNLSLTRLLSSTNRPLHLDLKLTHMATDPQRLVEMPNPQKFFVWNQKVVCQRNQWFQNIKHPTNYRALELDMNLLLYILQCRREP